MHTVIRALVVGAYYLVVTTGDFVSLVILARLGGPGFEVIVVALSGLLLVGMNYPNLVI